METHDYPVIHEASTLMHAWIVRHNATPVTLEIRKPINDLPTEFDEVIDDYDGGWRKAKYLRTEDTDAARNEYWGIVSLVDKAGYRFQAHHEQARQKLLGMGYSVDAVDSVPFVGRKDAA